MKVSTLTTLATWFAGIAPAMGDGTYSFTESSVEFTVEYYEDGRSKPYKTSFTYEGTDNVYTFSESGLIKTIESGDETYQVKYAGGYIKKLVKKSRRRQLAEEEEVEDAVPKQGGGRGLASACTGCFASWEVLCEIGSNSVYDIIAPDNPIAVRGVLTDEAEAGVFAFQEFFKDGCETIGSFTLCSAGAGCTCIPALQISLEPQDEGDIDLIITEPSGTVVTFSNSDGDYGFLDNDNINGTGSDPENYFVTDGLTGTGMLGTYSAKVSRFDAGGDFFFKLKASVGGIKAWKKKVTLKDGDDDSKTWTVNLDSYADNQCTSGTFNIKDDDTAPEKTGP